MWVCSFVNLFGILWENGGVVYFYFFFFDFKLLNSFLIKCFCLVIILIVFFVLKLRGNIFLKLVNVLLGKDMIIR